MLIQSGCILILVIILIYIDSKIERFDVYQPSINLGGKTKNMGIIGLTPPKLKPHTNTLMYNSLGFPYDNNFSNNMSVATLTSDIFSDNYVDDISLGRPRSTLFSGAQPIPEEISISPWNVSTPWGSQ